MNYLNPLLLGGLLAAAIPFVIYMFNRSQYKVHKWGAMHLLDAAMTTNRKKIKLEQILLLALRCSIPLFLALCMARPVITGMKNLIRNAKSSMVVLVDNSYSMESGDAAQNSFQKATEETSKVIDSLPRGSQVAVVGMAGPISKEEVSGYDLSQSRRVIRDAKGGFGSASPAESLESAAGLFAENMHHADRQLIIVSDFQKSSWGDKKSESRKRAFELVNSANVKPRLVLMDVGQEAQDNVAVESIELSQSIIGVGQKVKIRANIKNFSKQDFADLRVYFRADGESKAVSQANLGSGESTQVLFSYSFDKPGSHIVEVSIDADSLKADNACSLSVPVLDELPVLLVDGDPDSRVLKSETSFLNFALQPFAATRSELKDMTVPSTVEIAKFKPEMAVESRVMILANISKLNDEQLKAVSEFVSTGGGLMIFPGDKIDYNWYNDKLLQNGRGLLPLKLGKINSRTDEEEPASIVSQHYNHPALDLFNDPRNGSLSGASIKLWYELQNIEGGSAENETVQTLAKLDNGDALLVEKKFGHGRVILSSIPADADWSNLPMRPFYLPLMQQLTAYLASTVYPPRNLEIGQNLAAILPLEDAGKMVSLTDPVGNIHDLPVVAKGSKSVVEFEDPQFPGIYVLQTTNDETIHYVVKTERSESNLDRMSEKEIQDLARDMDAALVKDYEQYRETDQSRRYGQEIWMGLLWVVLIAAFGELFLIQHFTEKRV